MGPVNGVVKSKSASARFKQASAVLSHQRSVLQQQLAELEVSNSSLEARSSLISSWLDVLDLLRKAQTPVWPPPDADELYQQLEQELDTVRALLEPQLQQNSSSSRNTSTSTQYANPHTLAAEAPGSLDPMQQTIGSPHDAVAYFRDVAARPLIPGIENLTALQHLEQHKQLSMQLGIQLMQLECVTDHSRRMKALDNVKQLLDRHYHTLWSLIVAGKRDVVDATKVFNLETGSLLSPDSPHVDNQASIVTTLLPALQLSEAQEDATAAVMELCESLMAPIAAEISLIQQQLNDCITRSGAGTNITTTGSSGGNGSGGSGSRQIGDNAGASSVSNADADQAAAGAAAAARGVPSKALLEKQQQLLSRLSVLLRKQYHVVAGSTCIFLSGLTWVQAAKMIVCRWPYTASMQYVAKAVWMTQQQRVQQRLADIGPGSSSTPARTQDPAPVAASIAAAAVLAPWGAVAREGSGGSTAAPETGGASGGHSGGSG